MTIGPDILLKLVKEKNLVENLSERELKNPEGAGFDIRFGEVYEIQGKGFLGVRERKTPNSKLIAKYKKDEKKSIKIKSDDYFLIKTIEKVNLPKNIVAHVYSRSTLFRSGLLFIATQVAPGYKGYLTFGLKNIGSSTIDLELGARVAHIQFQYVEGGGKKYRGQWQGGRVSANKKEKQV